MAKWLFVLDNVPDDMSEDKMNMHAGNVAGRIAGDTYVAQVRKLEPSERVKVVEEC